MHYRILIVLVSTGLILNACDQTNKTSTSVPSVLLTSSTPIEENININPQLAIKGKSLYQQNCIFCHQADAIGKPGFAPSLTNKEFLSVASNKFLMSTIRDGRAGTGMPPFSHLGRDKVEAIVAYLRNHASLPDISVLIDAQPNSQGDPRHGAMWFKQICSTCHGFNGDGYSAGSTGTAIGKAGFLDKVSDGFIRYTIINGRTNTRMMGFKGPAGIADLSDQVIDDIIAYLRTVPSKG